MTDSYQEIREKFAGLTRGAEIQERVQQDAALKAAIVLEQESRAEAQARAEALAREGAVIAQAESAAVEKLSSLKALYQARQEAARQVIEAIAALWRIESKIRDGLSDADRIASSVEHLIEPTQRGAWRSSLRDRAGLLSQHIYAPDVKPTSEAQAIGVTVVRGITAGVIQPGTIAAGRDIVNL